MSLDPPTLEHTSSSDSNTSIASDSTQLLTPPLEPVEVDGDSARQAAKGLMEASSSEGSIGGSSSSNIYPESKLVISPTDLLHSRPRPSLPITIPDPVSATSTDDPIFANFSFGSCPSVPLASTPIAELGPFEYPEDLLIPGSSRSSISLNTPLSRRGSMARSVTPIAADKLGVGRRGSIPFREVEGQLSTGSAPTRRFSLAQQDPLPPRLNSLSPLLSPYRPVSGGGRARPGSSGKSISPDRAKLEAYRLDVRRGSLPTFAPMPPSPAKPLHLALRSSVDSGRPVLRHSLSFKFGSMSLESHVESPTPRHGPSPTQSPIQSPVDDPNMRRRTSRGPLHFSVSSRASAPIPPSLLAKRDKLGTRVEV